MLTGMQCVSNQHSKQQVYVTEAAREVEASFTCRPLDGNFPSKHVSLCCQCRQIEELSVRNKSGVQG